MKDKLILVLKAFILTAIIVLVAVIFLRQTEFSSVDLGRHLKNGEMITQDARVLYKNFYSYTEPDYNFINHHWLSGVIFWQLYRLGGFKLLTIFNAILAILTVLIFFSLSVKKSTFWLAGILALPIILILSERTDIRPEMFSFILLALSFYLIELYRQTRIIKYLYCLPLLELLWVNLHIYFFLGLFLIGLFVLEQIVTYQKNFLKYAKNRQLLFIVFFTFLAVLISPNFLKGALYPFNIFKRYGYDIVENKSPLYLENLMINYNITLFKIILTLLFLSFIPLAVYLLRKIVGYFKIWANTENDIKFINNPVSADKKIIQPAKIYYLIIAIFSVIISFQAVRNLPPFALLVFPIISLNFFEISLLKKLTNKHRLAILFMVLIAYLLTFFWLDIDYQNNRLFLKYQSGLGVSSEADGAVKFFNNNNLKGPIFNNYDLGSALIFWLYPKEKIFVDNRPEAYSVDFFQKIYIPMQQNDSDWKKFSEQYKINLIFFSHTDGTPWSKQFLSARLHDNNWPLLYFDSQTLIMIKNSPQNYDIISRYRVSNQGFDQRINQLLAQVDYRSQLNLANLAVLHSHNALARSIYTEMLIKRPENIQTSLELAYLLSASAKESDQLRSIDLFTGIINSGYRLPVIYNQLGLIYWNLSDQKQAVATWQKALSQDHGDASAKSYLEQASKLGD